MKRINRICMVLILLLCGILAVSCGGGNDPAAPDGGNAPDAVYFAKDQTLRKTYVEGQALSLSGVLLSCDTDGKTETVPADSPEVTVSGYDPAVLGEQTVTVTYRGKTATFRVTVIPRIAAEGYDTDYFVGDSFNKQNGRIRVADDNGTVTTVAMKDDSVTVSGFDSSAPGTKDVTVTVGGYSGTIRVNVLAVEKVTLKSPSKKIYGSDETEFSTEGGYLTVISTGGVIEKTVPLTGDMISGFNPGAATEENRESGTALKQTVRISYLGFDFDFEISVRYTDVTAVLDAAKKLEGTDLSRATDETVGSGAMEAMQDYFTLSDSERAKIPDGTRDLLARFASIYAYDRFVTATATYADVFALNPGESRNQSGRLLEYCGIFSVGCESYERMKAAFEDLSNGECDFLRFGTFLHTVETELPNLKIEDGKTPDEYFRTLYLNQDLELIVNMFRHMTTVYEKLSVVPADWDRESIEAAEQAAGIESAYSRIANGEFPYSDYPAIYEMLNTWRAGHDVFEIIHTHYLYNKTYANGEDYVSAVWEKIPFPGDIEQLYNLIGAGYVYSMRMKQAVCDTTDFMLAFRRAAELAQSIKDAGESLYLDIYVAVDFDDLFVSYLYSATATEGYSYRDVMGRLLYNADVQNLLWNDYYALLNLVGDDGKIDLRSDEASAAIEQLYADLWTVTPYERYLFICSLYSNYRDLNVDGYVFEERDDGYTGLLIGAILDHYVGENGVLPAGNARELFRRLLIATEQYGLRYKYLTTAATATDEYRRLMAPIVQLYGAMSAKDRAVFDRYAGTMYLTNLDLYSALTGDMPEIGTYPKLEELKGVLEAYFRLLDAIGDNGEAANSQGVYALLLAAYERANLLSGNILASGNADLIEAYRVYAYMVLNADDDNDANDYSLTLEAVFDEIRANAYSYNVTLTEEDGNSTTYSAIRYYTDNGLVDIFASCFGMLYTDYLGGVNTADDIAKLTEQYRALSGDTLSVFNAFHLDIRYFSALKRFYASVLEDDATKALATALIDAEQAYAACRVKPDSTEAAEAFGTAKQAVTEAYAAMETETEGYRTYLSEFYNYIVSAAT